MRTGAHGNSPHCVSMSVWGPGPSSSALRDCSPLYKVESITETGGSPDGLGLVDAPASPPVLDHCIPPHLAFLAGIGQINAGIVVRVGSPTTSVSGVKFRSLSLATGAFANGASSRAHKLLRKDPTHLVKGFVFPNAIKLATEFQHTNTRRYVHKG